VSEKNAVLDIRELTVCLPAGGDRTHALANVSCRLDNDEILCVVGESGSGKSVLARSIMGLLPAPHVRVTGGQVLFKGSDLLAKGEAELRDVRGRSVSMIFQEPMTALNPLMRIGAQMDEVLVIHGRFAKAERKALLEGRLRDVGLPECDRVLHSYPHELSGGQRQRAMIAMALLLEPAVLIADEPTTALDVTTQSKILALIKRIQAERKMAVMFITHDFGVVAEIADRVAVMQRGELVEVGETEQVLRRPQHPYTQALIAAVPSLVPRARPIAAEAPLVLKTQDLDKEYRTSRAWFERKQSSVRALSRVSISIRRGETLGVVGESGSGKSTLARCIARLVTADSGAILLGDTDLLRLSSRELRMQRRRFQMVFQDPFASLDPRWKVGPLIAEGLVALGKPREEALARALELLDLVGLDRRAGDRYPHEFSGGQRQRICIARALALDPELLIADEPVSALDVSVQAQVLKLLDEIRERLNLAMLFITHDLRVAAQVCDTVCVMKQGEIVEHGTVSSVFAAPNHSYTKELLAAVPGTRWASGAAAC
jgi:peptide/nickel transport system ATP-binding protein